MNLEDGAGPVVTVKPKSRNGLVNFAFLPYRDISCLLLVGQVRSTESPIVLATGSRHQRAARGSGRSGKYELRFGRSMERKRY